MRAVRALRIMNALVKALNKRGYTVSAPERTQYTLVKVLGEEIGIRLEERTRKVLHVPTSEEALQTKNTGWKSYSDQWKADFRDFVTAYARFLREHRGDYDIVHFAGHAGFACAAERIRPTAMVGSPAALRIARANGTWKPGLRATSCDCEGSAMPPDEQSIASTPRSRSRRASTIESSTDQPIDSPSTLEMRTSSGRSWGQASRTACTTASLVRHFSMAL